MTEAASMCHEEQEHSAISCNEPPLRVLILPPIEKWSVGEIRLSNPLAAWARKYGGEVRSSSVSSYLINDIFWADVIVLQRESSHYVIELIRRFQQAGKTVIFDIDDLLTQVPKFLSAYSHHKRTKPTLEVSLQIVDMVTTTTQRLAGYLAQYNPRITIIPNCPLSIDRSAQHYIDDAKPVTILVAASDTMYLDFIVPPLRRLMADSDIHLQILGIGPPGEFLERAGIPITRIDSLSYSAFSTFISSQDNAIGIIPLDISTFSSCKSAIKFLDYGLCGVPSICSNVPPYSDVVSDGVTGLLVENEGNAWYRAMRRLALDPDERARLATAARELCLEQYSQIHAADAWQMAITAARKHRHLAAFGKQALEFVPPSTTRRYWAQLLHPATYRAGLRILLNEGWGGVGKRLNRLFK